MKNKYFKILIALVLIIIAVISILAFNNLKSQMTVSNNIVENNTINKNTEEILHFVETNTKYLFKENAGIYDINFIEETDSIIADTQSRRINNINYPSINSVKDETPTPSSNITLNLERTTGAYKYDIKNDANFRDAKLFDNDVELLPKAIYLETEQNAFYLYNGIMYYIPVYTCDKADERIEYRNGLTIYRNNGYIVYHGNTIAFNFNDYYAEIDLKNIFDCYYLSDPSSEVSIYKAYSITNWPNHITFITYNGKVARAILRANNNNTVDLCCLPTNIAGNVDNCNNLFYQNVKSAKVDADSTHEFNLLYKTKEGFIELTNN